tara:strand:+ start:1874 stop:2881 length:1008 start_codon:yes stop_codon:yes gene_type:complete
MNILTDILGLFRRSQFAKTASLEDVLVLGINEEPEITGVASPIPYKNVKLIKIKDLKISPAFCSNENSPTIPGADTGQVFWKQEIDDVTNACTNYFRSLKSLSTNLTIDESTDNTYIEITSTGEPNTAANVGTGTGLWKNKVGETLNFRSLLAGDNITFTETQNTVSIAASSSTLAANVGTGAGVWEDKIGETLNFRSLKSNDNSINIQVSGSEINLDLSNIGPTRILPINIIFSPGNVVSLSNSAYNTYSLMVVQWNGANGTATLNLPAANFSQYRSIRVMSTGALSAGRIVNLTPIGGNLLDGSTSPYVLNQEYDAITVWSDGAKWSIIQKKI